MSEESENEADQFIGGARFLLPVTFIFRDDDDDEEADGDEDKSVASTEKEGRDRHPKTKETCGKSGEGTKHPGDGDAGVAVERRRKSGRSKKNPGDGDSGVAVETRKDQKDPPSQRSPGRGRQQYPSNRPGIAADGEGGRPRPRPSDARPTPPVKLEPGATGGHRGDEVLTCEECSYSTNCAYNLACHARVHSGERPYACGPCRLAFRTRSALNRHKRAQSCRKRAGGPRRVPSGPRTPKMEMYECPDCGYATPHAYNLKVHRRVHTDERPYECARCHLAFRTQSHLYRHERILVCATPSSYK